MKELTGRTSREANIWDLPPLQPRVPVDKTDRAADRDRRTMKWVKKECEPADWSVHAADCPAWMWMNGSASVCVVVNWVMQTTGGARDKHAPCSRCLAGWDGGRSEEGSQTVSSSQHPANDAALIQSASEKQSHKLKSIFQKQDGNHLCKRRSAATGHHPLPVIRKGFEVPPKTCMLLLSAHKWSTTNQESLSVSFLQTLTGSARSGAQQLCSPSGCRTMEERDRSPVGEWHLDAPFKLEAFCITCCVTDAFTINSVVMIPLFVLSELWPTLDA